MSNITIQFRQIVDQKAATTNPTSKRVYREKPQRDLFTEEAYRIYQHIVSLKRFLIFIRPVYLNTSHYRGQIKLDETDPLFKLLPTNVNHLTDQERDEIDFQAKLIIKQSIDRIKELEISQTIQPKEHSWAQWLHAVLPNNKEDVTRVHQSSITWLLNQQLTKVSKIQKEQQEIRLTREIEKSENQLSRIPVNETIPVTESIELNAFEEMLSKEQLQVLEKENSVMLESLNNSLNQIKSAEKALLEISTLQNQLTNHLAAQTLQTDRLYADALATTETVERDWYS